MSSTSHGAARRGRRTPEYKTWVGLRKRCLNPRDHLYPYYGGRGVTICQRWLESFEAFLEDVGKKPSLEMSIERIDNNKGYEPGNVCWATRTEQCRNRRSNRVITCHGETRTLAEWAEVAGLPYKLVHNRLNKLGWPVERALGTPKRGQHV